VSVLLLDTNIVSYLFKRDTRAASYAPHLNGHTLAISFMTVAELYQWAAIRTWGPRRFQQLEAHMRRYVVVPYDSALCQVWGNVRALCQRSGQPVSVQDAWIASTALHHQLPLVTHNPTHFRPVNGLTIITTAT
jgi:tRNA(fMet)-specific endonuclease VapC